MDTRRSLILFGDPSQPFALGEPPSAPDGSDDADTPAVEAPVEAPGIGDLDPPTPTEDEPDPTPSVDPGAGTPRPKPSPDEPTPAPLGCALAPSASSSSFGLFLLVAVAFLVGRAGRRSGPSFLRK